MMNGSYGFQGTIKVMYFVASIHALVALKMIQGQPIISKIACLLSVYIRDCWPLGFCRKAFGTYRQGYEQHDILLPLFASVLKFDCIVR